MVAETGFAAGSFLASLNPFQLRDLERRGRRRRWRRGAILFSEGEWSRWIAVLKVGCVKISSFTDEGDEVLLGLRGPGALVGELEAVDGEPRPATASALEQVEGLVVPHDEFAAFVCGDRLAMQLLLATLCERLRDADRKRVEYGTYDVSRRVIRRVVELADHYGQPTDRGVRVSLPLTQDELAGWTGASREAVSKALRGLRARGWIETGRRQVVVRNLPALREALRD